MSKKGLYVSGHGGASVILCLHVDGAQDLRRLLLALAAEGVSQTRRVRFGGRWRGREKRKRGEGMNGWMARLDEKAVHKNKLMAVCISSVG